MTYTVVLFRNLQRQKVN